MEVAESSIRRLDLRLVLPAGGAWLATGWALTASGHAALLVALGMALVTAIALGRRTPVARWVGLTGAVTLLCLVLAVVRVSALAASPVAEAGRLGAALTAEVVVDSDVRVVGDPGRERAQVGAHTEWVEFRGQRWRVHSPVLVVASGALVEDLVRVPAGARLEVSGLGGEPQPGRHVAAEVRLRSPPQVRAGPSRWMRQVNRVRAGLVASMGWSTPEQAGLTPSLVVGDTSGLLDETYDAFQTTGLTHLTAVSGTNLTMLLATLLVVARVVGVRGRWLHVIATLGVIVFVVVCRSEPSVLRAAAMGLVGLAAVGAAADRQRGIRHLSVAVIALMVVDPWLARSMGFALSVCASAGILWWGPPWRERLSRWMPGWLAESLAVPLSAQLATQPLVTSLSGSISTSGLLANVLAGPFVGPTTTLGLVAAVVSLISPALARPFGWLAGWCVQPVILIAHAGAGVPAATWVWPPGPLALVVLTVASLVSGLVMGWVLARRWVSVALALVLIGAMLRQPTPGGWPGQWRVAFCAVGQGDATVLNAGHGTAVLIDAAPEAPPVARCLASLGVRSLPLVILTHFHADHVGGFAQTAASTPVGAVLVNPLTEPAALAARTLSAAQGNHIAVSTATPGTRLQVGDVALTVVHAGAVPGSGSGGLGENSAENDSSIVVLADVAGTRVLLPGDIEPLGQRLVMDSHPDLSAQLIKMPHHGSSRQEPSFWQATGASIAVASAGERNSYGHPTKAALALSSSLGMRVLRTDSGESFTVWAQGARLQVRAARLGGL